VEHKSPWAPQAATPGAVEGEVQSTCRMTDGEESSSQYEDEGDEEFQDEGDDESDEGNSEDGDDDYPADIGSVQQPGRSWSIPRLPCRTMDCASVFCLPMNHQ